MRSETLGRERPQDIGKLLRADALWIQRACGRAPTVKNKKARSPAALLTTYYFIHPLEPSGVEFRNPPTVLAVSGRRVAEKRVPLHRSAGRVLHLEPVR